MFSAATESERGFGAMKPKSTSQLTPQELRVASLAAGGFSIKEIAERLHKSIHTITTQRRAINRKLEINKDMELSRWWFCTMFSISEEQIADKMRQAGALVLLALFSLHLSQASDQLLVRRVRGRRNETELII